MKGFEVKFNVFAESQEEADLATIAFKQFINENAQQGRAVTAAKLVNAMNKWKDNSFIKNHIINYFK